jgi:hypothetical protein
LHRILALELVEFFSNLFAEYSEEYFSLGEPSLKVAREISKKLNIDASIGFLFYLLL